MFQKMIREHADNKYWDETQDTRCQICLVNEQGITTTSSHINVLFHLK